MADTINEFFNNLEPVDVDENELTEEEKREAEKLGAELFIFKDIYDGDYFQAATRLGLLRALGEQDIDYYTGIVHQARGEYGEAVEAYKRVKKESDKYEISMNNLASVYSQQGDYKSLTALFAQKRCSLSETQQFKKRLVCLEYAMKNEDESQFDILSEDHIVPVKFLFGKNNDAEDFYTVCRIFSDLLIFAGEMINQCSIFQSKTNISGEELKGNISTAKFVAAYDNAIAILRLSEYVGNFHYKNDEIFTLAKCALEEHSWDDKIKNFNSKQYIGQIVQIIIGLNNPEMHKYLPRFTVLKNMMNSLMRIDSRILQSFLNNYFYDVVIAAKAEDPDALQYLGYTYAQILSSDKDPFCLKNRLETLFKNELKYDASKIIARTSFINSMTIKGREAYINAEETFQRVSERNYGIRDASFLALMFFRIFEIEYNERLIKPFLKKIDVEEIKKSCGIDKDWKLRSKNEQSISRKWEKELNTIKKTQEDSYSMPLGTIRVLLNKIHDKNDKCSIILLNVLLDLLTNDGKRAFLSKEMMDVIDGKKVKEYRNPGAHTGYVPYCVAIKAKELVESQMETVEGWFVQ